MKMYRPIFITPIKHMPKRQKIDPVWDFIDEINNMRYCKLCCKEYPKEIEITTIKGVITQIQHSHNFFGLMIDGTVQKFYNIQ